MKLDRRLNLVITVTRSNASDIQIHSVPIDRPVYESNFYLISRAVSKMYEDDLPVGTCARISLLMLRRIAKQMGKDEEELLEKSLLPEIWRLTNVIMPTKTGGWSPVPFDVVLREKTLTPDDESEVKNFLCFFTAASWLHKLEELETGIYPILRQSYGAQTTSLNCTEYAASLPISTPGVNIGEKVAQSPMTV